MMKRRSILRLLSAMIFVLSGALTVQAVELTKDTISDFITLYPGVYTEKEKALVEEYLEENKAIEERGTIDIDAMISGTLPENTPGYVRSMKISETMVRYFSRLRDPENPLLNDAEYAKKAGYKDIIAYPTIAAHDDSFIKAFPQNARDTILVADLIHSVTILKPVYPEDTLYWVVDKRTMTDLTPETGSIYRSNWIINQGSVYNQRGEKVLAVKYTVEENTKIYIEGKAPENAGFSDTWEERGRGKESTEGETSSGADAGGREGGMPGGAPGGMPGGGGNMPGGGSGSSYYYTDADWKVLKSLWAQENHRGSTPLYWEDVKIGDQPTWTLEGPVESSPEVSVPWGMGLGGNQTLKKYIMDEKTFKTLVRSETDGIYRPADEDEYELPVPSEAKTGMAFGAVGEMDAVLSGAAADLPDNGGPGGAPGGAPGGGGGDGGAPPDGGGGGGMSSNMMNFTRRDLAIRHISDWMGDSGWLYNIRWGGLYATDMAAQGEPGPAINPEVEVYIDNVPSDVREPSYILGKGNGGGKFIVVKSYVYKKYVKDGEFFVDLGWWIESDNGSNFGEGAATVRLPSRKAK